MDTVEVPGRRSCRAMGRIRSESTRPAPLWVPVPATGVALPVSR